MAQQDGGRAVAVVGGMSPSFSSAPCSKRSSSVDCHTCLNPPRLHHRAAGGGVDNCRSAVQRNALPLPRRLKSPFVGVESSHVWVCWRGVSSGERPVRQASLHRRASPNTPRCFTVAYNLGHSYEELGDFSNARRVYKFALSVNPKAVPCLVKAAVHQQGTGRLERRRGAA